MSDNTSRAEWRKDALISECGKYRHWLLREWDAAKEKLVFVMLNPSTADASLDDPTIRKCAGFAQRWGYGGLIVVNLCDFRATKPEDLQKEILPFSADCDRHIAEIVRDHDVICGWGTWGGSYQHRVRAIKPALDTAKSVRALKKTKQGYPQHPLYVAYETQPITYLRASEPPHE